MTGSELISDGMGSEEVDDDIGLEMLSAAHVLLSSERVTDQRDLLISTCLEALSSGPLSARSLTVMVNEIWPGAKISAEALENAMREAKELGLVGVQETLTGSDWALAKQGQTEIDATRAWFADAMTRLARQIQDRARDDFGEVTFEVASNWAQLILKLFSHEIARSANSYAGEVQRGAAGSIRPMVLDGSNMLRSLDGRGLEEGTAEFLKACLVAAVDETDPFGNELVGQIATSCVLHSIAAGRGRVAAQEALGSLKDQRVVLDTPVLVAYLGAGAAQHRLKSLVAQGVRLGMEVIAPEHVFDELSDVIARVGHDYLPGLIAALRAGTSPRAYALTVNEQVLELFADGVDAKKYSTWDDFTRKARGLAAELEAIGVKVRAANNKDRANVAWINQELTKEIAASIGGRGAKQIARDAESIELVWRSRRRSRRAKRRMSLWPGGWMVSYDRHINAAYRRVERLDSEPLVLTPAHWATLMTETAPAAEIPDLVNAAASYIRQESMMRIATKYPPAIALTLAKSLSGEYSSATDERVAQLPSLADMLEHASAGETVTGERLASELVSRRSNRLAAAGKEQNDLASLERERLDIALTRSTTVVSEEHAARVAAEARVAELEAERSLAGRKVAVGVIVTIGLAAILGFAVIHFWAFALGTAVGLVFFLRQSGEWLRDPGIRGWHLMWALAAELLGIWDLVSHFFHR